MAASTASTHGAVFLSYAREDTDAAKRIAEALRGFGVEVWFDQSELRGGDQWDSKIKKQIRECALFLPLVSAHTEERSEGYFRREWLLAVERTRDMASGRTFIVPVVIDDTPEAGTAVPEEFMRYQWTRLTSGEPTPDFVTQVKRLLETPKKPALKPELPRPPTLPPEFKRSAQKTDDGEQRTRDDRAGRKPVVPGWPKSALWLAILMGAFIGVMIYWATRAPVPGPAALPKSEPVAKEAPAAIADKSIAVLPFANMSPDPENAFFADGVHEEVITNLAKIRDLKVISRTSTLVYRDSAARNLRKIAEDLGVGTVLEGSVRRAGSKVRVTAQLIDARTDEHIWAETYDGDLTDIFALQARLAREIAAALKATLTAGEQSLIARRPTENQEAYDLFLRARALHQTVGERGSLADYQRVIGVYEQVIAKDPGFALAHTQIALVHSIMYWFGILDPTPDRADRMKAAVDAAVRLAPDAPETHLALGAYRYRVHLDWKRALAEFHLAAEGLPNDAQLSFWQAITLRRLGRWSESMDYFERSLALNPRDFATVQNYTKFLNTLRRWDQSRRVHVRMLEYFPGVPVLLLSQAEAQFALTGDREAFALAMEKMPPDPGNPDPTVQRLRAALIRGDLAAGDRILAATDLKDARDFLGSSVVNVPVSLLRASVAFLQGEQEQAARLAGEAIDYYRGARWNARQQPWVRMRLAQAAGLAGRSAEAIAEAEAALADMTAQDAFGAAQVRQHLGETYLAAGRNEQALAVLRQMMNEPCILSPNEIRIDPLWSRLKADPRLEEILKSAKPL
jgi:TolB-like protein/Flp pilus assembly protein TadD